VLRDDSGQNLRDYLIETAARLIDQRGSAGLAVRDIAREAQVADGALYNYFEDKEDLLVHALLAHVGKVMASAPRLLPPPGEGTVAENLRVFIDGGIANLLRVTPAFAGLISQPKVLTRFHAMVGGDAAFDPAAEDSGTEGSEALADGKAAGDGDEGAPDGGGAAAGGEPGEESEDDRREDPGESDERVRSARRHRRAGCGTIRARELDAGDGGRHGGVEARDLREAVTALDRQQRRCADVERDPIDDAVVD